MNLLGSAMSLRLGIFKPNFFFDADQVSQRQDIPGSLPQDHLDIASGKIVHLIRRIKQALDYVGHWLLLTWAASIALRRFAFEIALSVAFLALSITAAMWMRFGAFPWEML